MTRDQEDHQRRARVKHSGPDTRFCVLCLSGEHERVDDEPADEEQQPETQERW